MSQTQLPSQSQSLSQSSIIKHLVISGGGPNGIQTLGILQHLEIHNIWKIENIQTIYATSSGAILSVLIALKFDWETINNYIICRPWHETYKITADMIFQSYLNKGLFNINSIEIFYKPFFNSKDLDLGITMKEFFEYSGIELHFFSLEINSFKVVDISFKSFPDLPVIHAIYMSCSIPIIFCPFYIEDKCFIDGAVILNYPLSYCIKSHANKNEILGIKNSNVVSGNTESNLENKINTSTTILDYITHFIFKLIKLANSHNIAECVIDNECICNTITHDFMYMKAALYSEAIRKELLELGIKDATIFLEKIKLHNTIL